MPSLHPFIVHFPIALLSLAAVFEAFALFSKKDILSRAGWWMQLSGTIGLLAAILSGVLGKEGLVVSEEARLFLAAHEQLAFINGAAFGALLLWRIGSRGRIPDQYRILYILLLVLAAGILLAGAWYGGELVFRFGIGGPGGG